MLLGSHQNPHCHLSLLGHSQTTYPTFQDIQTSPSHSFLTLQELLSLSVAFNAFKCSQGYLGLAVYLF